MGKTCIGTFLRDRHGFRHLDFEAGQTRVECLAGTDAQIRKRIEELRNGGRDAVVTWGFVPDSQLEYVLLLRSIGFTWVWFDGNRAAAHREYLKAGRPEEAWVRQLAKIEAHIDPRRDALAPVAVNTFDASGVFREKGAIAAELLSLL
jgi:hypothetical protein